jgi:hypothetical protein
VSGGESEGRRGFHGAPRRGLPLGLVIWQSSANCRKSKGRRVAGEDGVSLAPEEKSRVDNPASAE